LAVSRAIVESEWVIPMPVSDIAGAMAEVSAVAEVSARFWQPAIRSTALKARIVFIVTPSMWSAVNELSRKPSLSPAETRREGISSCGIVKMNRAALLPSGGADRTINRNKD
jgi:hypothetical protein